MTPVIVPFDDGRKWLRDYPVRGFRLVFYPTRTKGPTDKGWPVREYKPEDYHDGDNVGVLTGVELAPGKFLNDVDFDRAEGIRFAKQFLQATGFGFGRASRPISHGFYTTTIALATRKFEDIDGEMLVELRGTKRDGTLGLQTMVPPSIHPSGERIEFRACGDPGHDDQLVRHVQLYAAFCLLLKHLGPRGFLHDARLAVAGFLLQVGLSEDEVIKVVETLAEATGNNVTDAATAVRSTAAKLHENKRVEGAGALATVLGDKGKAIVKRLREWLQEEREGDERFVLDNNHHIIANSPENIRRALNYLHADLIYDDFAKRALIRFRAYDGPLEDDILDDLWLAIDADYKFHPPMEVFTRVVKAEAREHKVHPIRDYLARLQWDRIPRLDRWLTTYGQAKDTTYVRAVGALVLIAAVRRVRQPGCKFDEFLILISNQGLNKSTALRTLCPDDSWFSDDLPLGVDAKGVIERTRAKWLIEASDLQGYARSQVEHLKAMLSRQTDGPARLAYARESVEVHRQFVLVGTTNHGQFLRDRTGNRRFWPVQVKSFDIPALLRDRDQLWAEAAHREAAGESIRLTRELWPVAACEQAARQVEDRWADILREVLVVDGKLADRIVLGTVWDALGISVDRSDERASERVNAIMQSLGYEKKNARGKTDGDTRVAKRWCLTGQPEQLDIVEEPAPLKEEKM